MRFTPFYFAILTAISHAFAHTRVRGISKFDPDVRKSTYVKSFSARAPVSQSRTKVSRFSPIPPPKYGSGSPKRLAARRDGPQTGGTHVRSAPRSQVSAFPSRYVDCRIQAIHENKSYGYIAPVWNEFGQYYDFQSDPEGSLLISFYYLPNLPSRLIFVARNSPDPSYPLFEAVVGADSTDNDFSPGSFNYAYITGATPAQPGSRTNAYPNPYSANNNVKKTVKYAFWTYDPATQDISAQWINTDESAPATYILHSDRGFIGLTGDPVAFRNKFGDAKVLSFKCVKP